MNEKKKTRKSVAEQFAALTPKDHDEMKTRLLNLAKSGAPRPAADTREGYALAQYTTK